MKTKIVEKPLSILREDFISQLLELLNKSGLPYFVIEDVLKDVIQEVNVASKKQLKIDKENYAKALAAAKKESG